MWVVFCNFRPSSANQMWYYNTAVPSGGAWSVGHERDHHDPNLQRVFGKYVFYHSKRDNCKQNPHTTSYQSIVCTMYSTFRSTYICCLTQSRYFLIYVQFLTKHLFLHDVYLKDNPLPHEIQLNCNTNL